MVCANIQAEIRDRDALQPQLSSSRAGYMQKVSLIVSTIILFVHLLRIYINFQNHTVHLCLQKVSLLSGFVKKPYGIYGKWWTEQFHSLWHSVVYTCFSLPSTLSSVFTSCQPGIFLYHPGFIVFKAIFGMLTVGRVKYQILTLTCKKNFQI